MGVSAARAAYEFLVALAVGLAIILTGRWELVAAAGFLAGLVSDRYLHALASLAGGACAAAARIAAYAALGAPVVQEAVAAAEVAGLPPLTLLATSLLVTGALEAAGALVGTFVARQVLY